MQTLKGKIIVITGAGQGLGETTAKLLAKEQAIIIGWDIKEEKVKNMAQEIVAAKGNAEGIKVDITDASAIDNALSYVMEKYQRIDILINNAGIDITKPVDELSIEGFDNVIAVNLRAPFILSQKMFYIMQKQGGAIINIASTAAKRSWANASAYHASKWGLLGMSHALHVEGRKKNIKVSAVIAGGMRTPFILERFPNTPLDVLQDPNSVAQAIKFILLQPDETVIPEMMILPFQETSWP